MKPRLLHARRPLFKAPFARAGSAFSVALLASTCARLAPAQAQRPAAQPGVTQTPAPSTSSNPSEAPATPGADQPSDDRPKVGQLAEPPDSATQTEFERRLSVMLAGNGLKADEVAKRAVQNSYAIAAKRRSLEA